MIPRDVEDRIVYLIQSTLGRPDEASELLRADAREMSVRLLNWMVEAGDTYLLEMGCFQEQVNTATSMLRNQVKRELLALTEDPGA